MKKLTVAFLNFANAHIKVRVSMTKHFLFTVLPKTIRYVLRITGSCIKMYNYGEDSVI